MCTCQMQLPDPRSDQFRPLLRLIHHVSAYIDSKYAGTCLHKVHNVDAISRQSPHLGIYVIIVYSVRYQRILLFWGSLRDSDHACHALGERPELIKPLATMATAEKLPVVFFLQHIRDHGRAQASWVQE